VVRRLMVGVCPFQCMRLHSVVADTAAMRNRLFPPTEFTVETHRQLDESYGRCESIRRRVDLSGVLSFTQSGRGELCRPDHTQTVFYYVPMTAPQPRPTSEYHLELKLTSLTPANLSFIFIPFFLTHFASFAHFSPLSFASLSSPDLSFSM
jgi:hypothetical protein